MPSILGNGIVLLVLLVLVYLCGKDVVSNIRDQISGKGCSGCSCGCSKCAGCSGCKPHKETIGSDVHDPT